VIVVNTLSVASILTTFMTYLSVALINPIYYNDEEYKVIYIIAAQLAQAL
jgi:hypothetical protein